MQSSRDLGGTHPLLSLPTSYLQVLASSLSPPPCELGSSLILQLYRHRKPSFPRLHMITYHRLQAWISIQGTLFISRVITEPYNSLRQLLGKYHNLTWDNVWPGHACWRCFRNLYWFWSTHAKLHSFPDCHISVPDSFLKATAFATLPPLRRGVENQSRGKETKNNNKNLGWIPRNSSVKPGWPPAQVNTSYHC